MPLGMSHSRLISGRITSNCFSTLFGLMLMTSRLGSVRTICSRIFRNKGAPKVSAHPPAGHHSSTSHPMDWTSVIFSKILAPTPVLSISLGWGLPRHWSSGYSYSEFEDIHPSEFSYPASSTSSSDFDWYAPSQTSHSSPASEFAMFDEMAPSTVYSATDTDLDHSLASMLSVFEAPLDLLES
ncbi:hypothetical protein C8R45DRAFT_91072 [Mycena sanguinolenta]|nr:hypothetical protein C8R45DRAFT_91072 [Mycena sanguinolenta]